MMTSSTSDAEICGTFAITADSICADRSSARMPTSDPLLARPIGLRAVATMTASDMTSSPLGGLTGFDDLEGFGGTPLAQRELDRIGRAPRPNDLLDPLRILVLALVAHQRGDLAVDLHGDVDRALRVRAAHHPDLGDRPCLQALVD